MDAYRAFCHPVCSWHLCISSDPKLRKSWQKPGMAAILAALEHSLSTPEHEFPDTASKQSEKPDWLNKTTENKNLWILYDVNKHFWILGTMIIPSHRNWCLWHRYIPNVMVNGIRWSYLWLHYQMTEMDSLHPEEEYYFYFNVKYKHLLICNIKSVPCNRTLKKY